MSDELDDLREQTRGTDRISASTDEEETERGDEGVNGADETESVTDETPSSESRTEAEVGSRADTPEPSEGFRETYEKNARRARRGVNPRSFSADDPGLSAFLLSLQQTDELESLGEAIREELGAPEPPEYDQDSVVRLALTYAVSETAPGYFEVLADGAR